MRKIIFSLFLASLAIGLCACNGSSSGTAANPIQSGFMRSDDSGDNWTVKNKISDQKSISSVDILSLTPSNQTDGLVFIGAQQAGIFKSTDNGETWTKINFPPIKVYGLVLNPNDNNIIYATGVWNKRGKIYKSTDGSENWDEIYTEPIDGTVIISLEIDRSNPQIIFSGNSSGTIVKSDDGGITWSNAFKASGPVISLIKGNGGPIYALINRKEIIKSSNGGADWEKLEIQLAENDKKTKINSVSTVTLDASGTQRIYIGSDKGMLKSGDSGQTWEKIKILNEANLPINAIVINPGNSDEIIYAAGQAIYKSKNGGSEWSTFQLRSKKIIRNLKYNSQNNSQIYAGFAVGTGGSNSIFGL